MAVALNVGVEAVSYQRAVDAVPTDYPRRKVNIPPAAAITSHVDRVFALAAGELAVSRAVRPRLSNPYVVQPDRYRQLFADIEAATRDLSADGEAGRIIQSARTLLLRMKADFDALDDARSALVKA